MAKPKLVLTWTIYLSLSVICIASGYAQDDAEQTRQAEDSSHTLVFGVYPENNSDYYSEHWKTLIEHISESTGLKVEFSPATSLEEFEDKVDKGEYDLVLLNANKYTEVHAAVGYRAFAKELGRMDNGVIVVQQDSKIKTLDDLKSQTLAFSDPRHFSSMVLTQSHLHEKGIPVKVEYVESDKSVYRGVEQGDYTAGGGNLASFNDINPSVHARLRVIWTSKQYSSNAFAAHPRVSEGQLTQVKNALVELDNDVNGLRLLANVKFKGIAEAKDDDWNDIRQLKRLLSQ